jgi:2-aminoadipate transaminase
MFLWVQLPAGLKAIPLLDKAVKKGVAFVPGSAFYATHEEGGANESTLRLSFVTATVDQINTGMAALAAAIRESLSSK